MNKLSQAWNYLINLGTNSRQDESESIKIRMTNYVYIFSTLFSTCYGLYLIHLQYHTPAYTVFGMGFICLILIVLNYLTFYRIGKLIYIFISNYYIYYLSSFLGFASGVHLYVMLSPVIILSFFHIEEVAYILSGLGLYIITFLFIMEIKDPTLFPPSPLSESQQHIFYIVNVFFSLLLSFFLMVFLLKSNHEKNKELLHKQETLMESQRLLEEEIEEHKIARETLRVSEQRLSAAMEAAQQGLWDYDLETKEVIHDHLWTKIVELDDDYKDINELINMWMNKIDKKGQEKIREKLDLHLRGALPLFECEYSIQSKSGKTKWILSRGKVAQYNKEGKPVRVVGTIQDITVKKEFEKELRKSKEIAEQASIAKAQFLSVMSHEIRTPINAVIGITHLLLQENPRPDQLENLNILKTSSQNLLLLINDILDFNKIEAGKIDLEETDFNLRNLLKSIRQTFALKAEEKQNKLMYIIDPAIPNVIKGDPTRIGQILTNLISNAIKFTENGRVVLECKLENKDDDYAHVNFAVKDTGIGMAGDVLASIFEPFQQANSSITRRFGGTGLGLSIAKKLVELQGGTLSVRSEVGQGSEFRFSLKLKIGRELIPEKPLFNITELIKDTKVLLVDDNHINQMLTWKLLSNAGLKVDIASSGSNALEKIEQDKYDIILMDLQMPDMDGYETTAKIRESKSVNNQAPIIALTAEAFVESKNKASEAGMTDYIVKPFNPNELFLRIAIHTGKSPV
ncbi:MAG TPA: response regulator [Cytophagaceae bacterium]